MRSYKHVLLGLSLAAFLANALPARAVSPPGDVVGKLVVGYQGWFACPGDGSPNNRWVHWASGTTPSPGNQTFELWPDTREFTTTYQTGYANLGNGQPAKLFTSYDQQVVNTQFTWMQQNNIDCAALQRFGSGAQNDGMTQKVRTAAEAAGRKFYIMYDISGWTNVVNEIENDWTNTIVNTLHATSSTAYAKQNGKPVVCIWGIGFSDGNHPGTAAQWLTIVNWFKSQGCYVIEGVPTWWLNGINDSQPGFLGTYHAANMLSPWMVGRFSDNASADSNNNSVFVPEFADCNSNGIDFQPVIFPGFSWSNWNGGNRNAIPRRAGDFLWHQAANVRQDGIGNVYLAMFDEFDEGTAISKAAEDSSMAPTNQYFLTLDADGTHLSSDFYLRETNDVQKMIKGQTALTFTCPTPFTTGGGTVPAAPTGLAATAGNAQASLSWAGSSGATSYNLYRGTSPGGESATPVKTGMTGSPVTDTGLTNGTAYYYKVAAVNASGTSSMSNEATVTPTTGGITGIDLIVTSVTLSPASPNTGDHVVFSAVVKNQGNTATPAGTIIGVQFAVDGTTSPLNWSDTDTASLAAGASVTLTANNGTNGVNYWTATSGSHSVQAWVDDVNRIAEANENNNKTSQAFTVGSGATAPSTPSNLTATAGNTIVALSWTASSGTAPITYSVYRGTAAGQESTTAIASGISGTSYTNTGVSNNTKYYYTVKAVNSKGTSAASNEASATPVGSAPAAPTNLTATAGNAQIALSWTGSTGATSYNIYRGTTAGGESATAVGTSTSASFTNTGLTNGTTYYYTVKAVNANGNSGASNEAHAAPSGGVTGIDLIVTSITWSPSPVASGNHVIFTATIKNQGSVATPAGTIVGVQFAMDGSTSVLTWNDKDTTSLGAGQSVTLTATGGTGGNNFWTAASGSHTVQAWVDDVNRIAESNEGNNKLTATVSVP